LRTTASSTSSAFNDPEMYLKREVMQKSYPVNGNLGFAASLTMCQYLRNKRR